MGALFSENLFSKNVFILYLKWFNFSHWNGSMGKGNVVLLSIFRQHVFVGAGEWGWESGDGSMGMGAFLSENLIKILFFMV